MEGLSAPNLIGRRMPLTCMVIGVDNYFFSYFSLSLPRILHRPLQKIKQTPAIYFPFTFGSCPFN